MTASAARTWRAARAIGYVRVSTDAQELGPEAQRTTLAQWCASRSVELVAVCVDRGVSGGAELDQRPELLRALHLLRLERAGVLLVARRDRLARDVGVALAIERAARAARARVESCDGVSGEDSPHAAFLRTVLDGASQYERALIRARTREAMAVLRRAQRYTGGAARFGWRSVDGVLVAVPEEQAVRRRAHDLRAEGKTLRAIVEALCAEGHRSRRGTPLTLTQVARILAP